jgi:putative sterol carrier protein
MAKLYTTELAKKTADACLQYFGGYGYMDDYPISRIYRDARVGTIVGGTSEIMREIIAKLFIDNGESRLSEEGNNKNDQSSEPPKGEETLPADSEKKESEAEREAEELPAHDSTAPPEEPELPGPAELTAEGGDPEGDKTEEAHLTDSETQWKQEEEIIEEVVADKGQPEKTEIAEMNSMEEKEETEEAAADKSLSIETEIPEGSSMEEKEETEEAAADKSLSDETEIAEGSSMEEKEETEETAADKSLSIETEIPEGSFPEEKEETEESAADKSQLEETEIAEMNFREEKESPLSTEKVQQENSEAGLSKPQTMVDKIVYNLPGRFRAEKAGDMETVIHLKISGNDGGEYTVAIKEGQCMVTPGLAGQPRCVTETSAKTYIDMETGKTNPQIAFMMGKVRISNIPEMMQFNKMFSKLPDP